MKVLNPLQINDWEYKPFLIIILSIQFAMWGAIGMDSLGIQIPILRQLVGSIYLIFIPGVIILRILKLHKLGNIETLLYSAGLSISVMMFAGLFINTIYPSLGIPKPISLKILITTISAFVMVLSILSYIRDKNFSDPSSIDTKDILSPAALFLICIPFLAIYGSYLTNFYQNNILLMFMILVISAMIVSIGFNKFIPQKLYPLTIFMISIALLFHNSLISKYIWGWDIHLEYYLSNLVITDSLWNPVFPSPVNAMLSIVMVSPIFSYISNMDLTSIFKIIYPLIFSLVPLGLYRVFQKQMDDKIAFFACFFFISISTFYTEMLALARQQIAELFLTLLILLMIDTNMAKMKRSFLLIIFSISLIVSHYGLSYILMAIITTVWIIFTLFESSAMHQLMHYLYSRSIKLQEKKLKVNPLLPEINDPIVSSRFVFLFIISALTWYTYVSGSAAFSTIIHISDHITSSIYKDFLNPQSVQGLNMVMTKTATPVQYINKIINLLNQVFILAGIFVILKYNEIKFEKKYLIFSLVNLFILFASVSVPFFASSLNMTRIYHITLFFLAPSCVIGGIAAFNLISKNIRFAWTDKNVGRSLKILSIYFVIFWLYQIGFIYQVAEGSSQSISIGQESIKKYGDMQTKLSFYSSYIPEQDIFSAKWLSKARDPGYKIYSDSSLTVLRNNVLLSTGGIYFTNIYFLTNKTSKITDKSYTYLRYLNIVEDMVPDGDLIKSTTYNMTEISYLIEPQSEIYSNGNSKIYIKN
jgi:uncharacterized membrane protein